MACIDKNVEKKNLRHEWVGNKLNNLNSGLPCNSKIHCLYAERHAIYI